MSNKKGNQYYSQSDSEGGQQHLLTSTNFIYHTTNNYHSFFSLPVLQFTHH